MQAPDNIALLDAVYFAAIQRRAVKALRESARSVRYARGEFESLKSEQALLSAMSPGDMRFMGLGQQELLSAR